MAHACLVEWHAWCHPRTIAAEGGAGAAAAMTDSDLRTRELQFMFAHADTILKVPRGSDTTHAFLHASPCATTLLPPFQQFLHGTLPRDSQRRGVGDAIHLLMTHPDAATTTQQEVAATAMQHAFAHVASRVASCAALDWWVQTAVRLVTPPADTSALRRSLVALNVVQRARDAALRAVRRDQDTAEFHKAWRSAHHVLATHATVRELTRVEQVVRLRLHHAAVHNVALLLGAAKERA